MSSHDMHYGMHEHGMGCRLMTALLLVTQSQAHMAVGWTTECGCSTERGGLDCSQASIPWGATLVTHTHTHLLHAHSLLWCALQPFSFQSAAEDTKAFLTTTNPGKVTLVAAGALVAGSFLLACWRYWQKFQSAQAKRQRQVRGGRFGIAESSRAQ
jgi:hypothetical protein